MEVFSFVPVEHLFIVCFSSCLFLISLRSLKILIIDYISTVVKYYLVYSKMNTFKDKKIEIVNLS